MGMWTASVSRYGFAFMSDFRETDHIGVTDFLAEHYRIIILLTYKGVILLGGLIVKIQL